MKCFGVKGLKMLMRGKSHSVAGTFGCFTNATFNVYRGDATNHRCAPMINKGSLFLCSYIGEFAMTVEVYSCLLPFLIVLFTCQFFAAVSEEIARMQGGSPPLASQLWKKVLCFQEKHIP